MFSFLINYLTNKLFCSVPFIVRCELQPIECIIHLYLLFYVIYSDIIVVKYEIQCCVLYV